MKSKLAKNLISLGVAIAAVFVIAFVTKPKLPAPENLSATILLAERPSLVASFKPAITEGGTTFATTYRMRVQKEGREIMSLEFNTATQKLEKFLYQDRNISQPNNIFANFSVSIENGEIVLRGEVPQLIIQSLQNAIIEVNSIDELKRTNTSPAAKAQISGTRTGTGEIKF